MSDKKITIMLSKIDMTIDICRKSLNDESLELYHNRYEKLLNSLLNIRKAVVNDCLYTGVTDLNIVKMIINNDTKNLYESILETNLYFRENYSSVL